MDMQPETASDDDGSSEERLPARTMTSEKPSRLRPPAVVARTQQVVGWVGHAASWHVVLFVLADTQPYETDTTTQQSL